MTDTPDQLYIDLLEVLSQAYCKKGNDHKQIDFVLIQAMAKSLASFVREQVLAERRKCVEKMVTAWVKDKESPPDFITMPTKANIYYARLLGLKEGKCTNE